MKTTLLPLLVAFNLSVGALSAADPITESFQKALFEEEANQNLDAAIKAYQTVVDATDAQRRLAATAVFRLGECYRKLGQTNAALAQYERLLRDYADQTNLVTLSRQNVAGLGAGPNLASLSRTPARSAEADAEVARLESLLAQLKGATNWGTGELLALKSILLPDQELIELMTDKKNAELRLATYRQRQLPETHPDIQSEKQGLTNLQTRMAPLIAGVLRALDMKLQAAKAAQAALAGPVVASAAARAEQRRLLEEEIKMVEQQVDEIKKTLGSAAFSQNMGGIKQVRELLALRRQLAALDIGPAATAPAGSAETGATDEEDKEIRRIQALIQNSPDLINVADTNGITPLMQAAMKGHLATARLLLDTKLELEAREKAMGVTALLVAVAYGQKTMSELLLAKGADVNARDKDGRSPLFYTAALGFRAVAEVLLDHKADVNLKDKRGRTPIFEAAEAGQLELAELLLRRGADVNAQDENRFTALHGAASKGRDAIVALLLKWKADVDGKNQSITPLVFAVEQGQATTADLLLKAGADVRVKAYGGTTTLLHLACGSNKPLWATVCKPDVLKVLLAHKPALEATDSAGYTPLQLAVTRSKHSGATESVQLLIEAGADPNRLYHLTGDNRYVPDDRSGYPSLDSTGCTPLVVASFLGQTAVVKSLLAHGAEVNAKSSTGMTPLLYAVEKKSLPTVEAILAHKPDLEVVARGTSGYTYTALALAISSGEAKMAQQLIQAGANVNAELPESWNSTPLHVAVSCREREMVELLLTNNAKVNVINKKGQTPIDAAQEGASLFPLGAREHEAYAEIAALLLKYGADENFTRRSYIAVARKDRKFSYRVFTKGTNDWNRYTLLELIATAFAKDPPANQLRFPDLSRVTIQRLGAKGEPDRQFNVDLATVLNSEDCTNAPWLEWGDIVDLPELDHPVSEQWIGLAQPVREALTKCLQREVSIVIKDETRKVVLRPSEVVGTRGAPGPIPPGVFRLNQVLRCSKLLRVSSDLSRVQVKRTDPISGQPVQWTFDLSPEVPGEGRLPAGSRQIRPTPIVQRNSESGMDTATDLWLRDGDVIEVPEK